MDFSRQPTSPRGRLLVAAVVCAMLLVVGWIEGRLVTLPKDAGTALRYLYPFQQQAFVQLGAFGAVLCGLLYALRRVAPRLSERVQGRARHLLPRLLCSLVVFFVTGEIAVRIYYRDGMSFATHGGPIVRRFERDFRFNRYGARGPEIAALKKDRHGPTILVQGDSITWGQGVRDEASLYTSRLLERLRRTASGTEMAVLAKGGREIDGHRDELRAWGEEIEPDVIVYQWHINDGEFRKNLRPAASIPWRRLFFHRGLCQLSYLWFYLDYGLQGLLPAPDYNDYYLRLFSTDTPDWDRFTTVFQEWAAQAKAHAGTRVIVVLYPFLPDHAFVLKPVHARVRRLCEQEGLEVLDLADVLADVRGNREAVSSTPYDTHPNAQIHGRIADALHARLLELWPEHFAASESNASAQ